jgi:hypothetical protein
VIRIGKKTQAGENDLIYHSVVTHPLGTKYLAIVWYNPDDPGDEPVITLWGPYATDKECWNEFRRLNRGNWRKACDWDALPEPLFRAINARIKQGVDRLTAH